MFNWFKKEKKQLEDLCVHEWSNWSELELVGCEYASFEGNLQYSQRKNCTKCNKTILRNQTIKGRGFDARLAECRRHGIKLSVDEMFIMLV